MGEAPIGTTQQSVQNTTTEKQLWAAHWPDLWRSSGTSYNYTAQAVMAGPAAQATLTLTKSANVPPLLWPRSFPAGWRPSCIGELGGVIYLCPFKRDWGWRLFMQQNTRAQNKHQPRERDTHTHTHTHTDIVTHFKKYSSPTLYLFI